MKDVCGEGRESPIGGNATTVSSSSSSSTRREGGVAPWLAACCCGADGSAGFWFFSGLWPWNRREREERYIVYRERERTKEREREREREYKSCGSKRAGPRNGNASLQGSLSLFSLSQKQLEAVKGKKP